MKNAHQILSSLKSTPEFSKLEGLSCLKKLQTLFNPYLQSMIHYAYIKNSTLFFVLTHPGAKQEFDNSIASIKDALKMLATKCEGISFSNVRAYATFKPSRSFQPHVAPMLMYHERSHAHFKNTQTDTKLHDAFEKIRALITTELHKSTH